MTSNEYASTQTNTNAGQACKCKAAMLLTAATAAAAAAAVAAAAVMHVLFWCHTAAVPRATAVVTWQRPRGKWSAPCVHKSPPICMPAVGRRPYCMQPLYVQCTAAVRATAAAG